MSEHGKERRRFQRIATDKAVTLRVGALNLEGTVKDVSLRGLLFIAASELPDTLAPGDAAHAIITLDDDSPTITLDGDIAHLGSRQVGIRCTSMALESAARLRRMVELNLEDPDLLERELSQLLAG